MAQQLDEGDGDEPAETDDLVGAVQQTQRHFANSRDEADQGVVRRDRVRQCRPDAMRPHLIEQRRQVRPHIGQGDGVAARRQRGVSAFQEPGAGGVQPFDPGEVKHHVPAARKIQRAKPAIQLRRGGEEPVAFRPKDQRVRICGGDKGCARRHALKVLADDR